MALLTGEVIMLLITHTDKDGNVWFHSRMLKPYHLPVTEIQANIDGYLSHSNTLRVFDASLGWTNRPNATTGIYSHDDRGIRVENADNSSKMSVPDVLRIALFGDSFIYGEEVPFENTIGFYVGKLLADHNLKVEVMNFGVPAYGMDQAYLRWLKEARRFAPDVVILGFQPENVKRNVNLVRALYLPGDAYPFLKPRFVLEHDTLALKNYPVPIPDSTAAIIEHMIGWRFRNYETFYKPEDYEKTFWLRSRLVAYAFSFWEENRFNIYENERRFYAPDLEPVTLTLKIVEAFKRDVQEKGGAFFLVHLPRKADVKALMNKEKLSYDNLLAKLDAENALIHPERKLLEFAGTVCLDSLFAPEQHYSGHGNYLVAEEIVDAIGQQYLVK
ncbi:MAG: SGNH/GDSL hydrolase family protein [Flavobacteriales bacterium]|nr:SGNH/GDSL hydrolase family protein [Flavobacteriales bacterium]MCB9447787.1 SGNH/GDSL hydrolase family protein [Flavobacteriales bacterium]